MELREALTQIAEIRSRVAQTERFDGYRAGPVACTGLFAVLAGLVQSLLLPRPASQFSEYLLLWSSAAIAGVVAAGMGIHRRHRTHDLPLSKEMTRLAVSQFLPCLVAGALMTMAIARHSPEFARLLPGLWQVLFSLGIFASCRLLPKPIVGIGGFYLAAGVLNLGVVDPDHGLSPWAMALPFGLGQLGTAAILYVHLERPDGERTLGR